MGISHCAIGGQCTAVLTMRVNQMLTIFLVLLVFGSTVDIREEYAALELLEDGLSASEQLHQSSILSQSAEVDDQDAVLAGRRGPVTFQMPPNFLQQMVDDREKKRAAFKSITARIEAAEKTLAKNKQQAERHRKHQHKLDAKTTSLENKVLTGGKGGKGRTGGKGGRGSRIAQKEATCKACGTCMSIPGNPQATTDPMCAPCANGGQSWWPCDVAGLCQCKEAAESSTVTQIGKDGSESTAVTQIGKPTHAERKAAVKAAADEAAADKALAEEDAKRKAAERKAADKALADEAAADKALAENTRKAADKAKADEAAADKALAEHTRKAADKKEADKAAADRLLAQHKVLAAQAALHVKRLAAAGATSKARAKAAEDKARVEKQNAKIARAKAQRILANRQRASRSANRGRGRRASANRRRKRGGRRGGKRGGKRKGMTLSQLRLSRSRHRKGGRRLLSHSDDLNFPRNEVRRIRHALASN